MARIEEVKLEFSNIETLFNELKAYAKVLYNSQQQERFCLQVAYSTRTYPRHDMNYVTYYEHNTEDARVGRIELVEYDNGWNAFGFTRYDDYGNVEQVTTISAEMLMNSIFRNEKAVDYFISVGTRKEYKDPYWISFGLE